MTARADRIPLLLGHFGGHNAGDEAILDGTCHLLQTTGVPAVRVVSKRIAYSPRVSAAISVEVVAAAPMSVFLAVLRCSMVVVCGGTHFNDDFPIKRRIRHYNYLLRYLAVAALARVLRRPVVAIGQGIGPIVHPGGRVLTRFLFGLVPAGTLRDDASLARARALGAGKGWHRTFDTAVAVPPRRRAEEPPRRAIGVAPVFGTGSDALWEVCGEVLAGEAARRDASAVHVVAFRGGHREDDRAIARRIAARISAFAPVRLTVFDDDVDAVVEELTACRVVVCGRYHALVMSLLAGAVPVVLPVHPKLADLAATLDLPAELIVRTECPDELRNALHAAHDLAVRGLGLPTDEDCNALDRDRALLAVWEGRR